FSAFKHSFGRLECSCCRALFNCFQTYLCSLQCDISCRSTNVTQGELGGSKKVTSCCLCCIKSTVCNLPCSILSTILQSGKRLLCNLKCYISSSIGYCVNRLLCSIN